MITLQDALACVNSLEPPIKREGSEKRGPLVSYMTDGQIGFPLAARLQSWLRKQTCRPFQPASTGTRPVDVFGFRLIPPLNAQIAVLCTDCPKENVPVKWPGAPVICVLVCVLCPAARDGRQDWLRC